MRPFKSTISIDEARRLLREGVRPIERVETVPLIEAEGRVAAADVQSTIEVPPFARSAMDGYAVMSRDVSAAGSDRPVRLRIVDRIYTGQVPRTSVAPAVVTGALRSVVADIDRDVPVSRIKNQTDQIQESLATEFASGNLTE